MSNLKTISQGEDLEFTGKLIDTFGLTIDLTAITYQLYVAIHDGYGTIVKKFANDNGSDIMGWQPIDVSAGNNGEFTVFLYSSETKPLREGNYFVEVRMKVFMALYGPDDGALDVVEPRVPLFYLLKSTINPLLP